MRGDLDGYFRVQLIGGLVLLAFLFVVALIRQGAELVVRWLR